MFEIVLYEPEIPPNTGNIIRLCANSGCRLHLVKPLGFRLTDRALRRAGLDYHEAANVTLHADWHCCAEHFRGSRMLAFTTRARNLHTQISYARADVLLFGPETRGLPRQVLESIPEEHRLKLPMRPSSRSLNLSNAAAIVVYEGWRQLAFSGAA